MFASAAQQNCDLRITHMGWMHLHASQVQAERFIVANKCLTKESTRWTINATQQRVQLCASQLH